MPRNKQRGLSLIELIIAITVLSLLTVLLFQYFEPWARFKAKLDTQQKLAMVSLAVETAYRESALTVDSVSDPELQLPTGTITAVTQATDSTFSPVSGYAKISAADLARDGYGKPLTVFISQRLSRVVAGTTIYYRIVAIVSSGMREGAPLSTFDANTGALTLDSDETAIIVDGYQIQRSHYSAILDRLKKLADAYTGYFQSRYLADPGRSIGINYFANRDQSGAVSGSWDSSGRVANSATVASPANLGDVGLDSALGLSSNDVLSSYGSPIYIDNASDSVRHPGNTDVSMRIAPFTARLWADLPGSQTLTISVMGTY